MGNQKQVAIKICILKQVAIKIGYQKSAQKQVRILALTGNSQQQPLCPGGGEAEVDPTAVLGLVVAVRVPDDKGRAARSQGLLGPPTAAAHAHALQPSVYVGPGVVAAAGGCRGES